MALPKWAKLRKFTLEYCDLPTMIWNVAVVLRVLALNIESGYNKRIPFYYYLVTLAMMVCYFSVYLFDMMWFVFVRCAQTGDLIAATVVLSLGISSEIGPMKLLYMFVYIDKIRKLTDDYLECDAQTIPGTRFHRNLYKSLKRVKLRALVYWMVVFNNGNLYLLLPSFFPGRNLPENLYVIYGLEPMLETPNYEIAWTMMGIGVYYICYVPACVTAYLIVITGYTEAQMLALSEEMVSVWPDAVKHTKIKLKAKTLNAYDARTKIILNQYIYHRLKEIIIHHSLLLNLFRNVENIFRSSIAMGFFLLTLGLIAELLGKLENTFMQMPFALMQVSMDCLTGQRVMDASVVFERAVYDCQWENFDKKNMKMVLVMLKSSQKTMSLSAGGLATLSFACLMTVTRGIYSTYTTLRSTI